MCGSTTSVLKIRSVRLTHQRLGLVSWVDGLDWDFFFFFFLLLKKKLWLAKPMLLIVLLKKANDISTLIIDISTPLICTKY
jgi:hypothetical protein